MASVKLSNGLVAYVDKEDLALVSQYRWFPLEQRHGTYARSKNKDLKTVYLHRLVLEAPSTSKIDHIDGNPLNNRKINLRICSNTENVRNRTKIKSPTGYKGVKLRGKSFAAYITVNRRSIYLGLFKTPQEAGMAYNRAAMRYFGEFASLNPVRT